MKLTDTFWKSYELDLQEAKISYLNWAIGYAREEDDILALSDPPYYTACPNPFLDDFIKYYGKPYDAVTGDYRREPFAADVSENTRYRANIQGGP